MAFHIVRNRRRFDLPADYNLKHVENKGERWNRVKGTWKRFFLPVGTQVHRSSPPGNPGQCSESEKANLEELALLGNWLSGLDSNQRYMD